MVYCVFILIYIKIFFNQDFFEFPFDGKSAFQEYIVSFTHILNFPALLPLLISIFKPLKLERNAWFYFNVLSFVKLCFVAYCMIYPGECSVCTLEECLFWCCWMNVLHMSGPFGLKYGSIPIFFIDFLSGWFSVVEYGYWNPQLSLYCYLFLTSYPLVFA